MSARVPEWMQTILTPEQARLRNLRSITRPCSELASLSPIADDLARGGIECAAVSVGMGQYELWRSKKGFMVDRTALEDMGHSSFSMPVSIAQGFRAWLRAKGFTRGGASMPSRFFAEAAQGLWVRRPGSSKPNVEGLLRQGSLTLRQEDADLCQAVVSAGLYTSIDQFLADIAADNLVRKEAA